jgi:transcriptional regulator with XRE-family HTH domain
MVAIKQQLQALMAHHKLSGYELARRAGVNQPTLQRILSGETVEPKTSTLKKIADYFHVTVEDLTGPLKDWKDQTGPFAALTPEALDLLAAFQRLTPERQAAYLDTMFMEVFMIEHMPWLKQGRPKKESYTDFERRMVTLAMKKAERAKNK